MGGLGEVPHGLGSVGAGHCQSVAGRTGGAGHWSVLGAGERHRWVHEAEEGVSSVPLHLSWNNNNTLLKHQQDTTECCCFNDTTGRKPTCLKKAWVSSEDAEGLQKRKTW